MSDNVNYISFQTELEKVLSNDPDYTFLSCDNYTIDQTIFMLEALENNTTVEILIAKAKGIGDNVVGKICDILKNNNTLKIVDFCGNNISEAGAEAFANALKTNTTLLNFYLRRSSIRQAATQSSAIPLINLYIQRNRKLWKMQFWSPWNHKYFLDDIFDCKTFIWDPNECDRMVIASLICNTGFITPLPMSVWKCIFSFWRLMQWR